MPSKKQTPVGFSPWQQIKRAVQTYLEASPAPGSNYLPPGPAWQGVNPTLAGPLARSMRGEVEPVAAPRSTGVVYQQDAMPTPEQRLAMQARINAELQARDQRNRLLDEQQRLGHGD